MSHRYLPWVRRGLANAIDQVDDLSDGLSELASFDIGVQVNEAVVPTSLRVHGPGDVIGVDPRVIIRTDPERYIADFEPNHLVSIEFDQPDFPWMFTPAKADPVKNRLRPWLVLVVVENKAGVTVGVRPDAPLPALQITDPADPADELPDPDDSWAWAHAQVISDTTDPEIFGPKVLGSHDLNLSRLVCPRRLTPARRYFACLVPAFEVGRRAGLGLQTLAGAGLTPAWGSGLSGLPNPPAGADPVGTVTLPVYFHWEFSTGPGGSDFEELVDRINPVELADDAGTIPMYIGDPGQGIAPIPETDAVLGMEGALRPISTAPPASLADVPAPLQAGLAERLDAPADHLDNGAADGEIPIGPPLYGSYHLGVHRTGQASAPTWFDQLNLDPRMRAAAAIGSSIVKDNQEELMDEAWAQVGDVIEANRVLNQAALSRAAGKKAFDKHLRPLADDQLFVVTSPSHRRTSVGSETLRRAHDRGRLPNAATDPAFRRATSGQNRVLKRAGRRAAASGDGVPDGGPGVTGGVVGALDDGTLALEDLTAAPDGVGPSQVIDHVTQVGDQVDMTPVGGTGPVPGYLAGLASVSYENLPSGGQGDLTPRLDLGSSGLITDVHMRAAAEALGGEKRFLLADVGQRLASLRPPPGSTGLEFVLGPDGVIPRLTDDGGGGDGPGRPRRSSELDPDGSKGGDGGEEGGGDVGVSLIPIPDGTEPMVRGFGFELEAFRQNFEPDMDVDVPHPLGLGNRRDDLLTGNDPQIVAGRRLEHTVDRGDWPFEDPFDPIMVGPRFHTPLHGALADKGREYFLPGIGDIPPNSIVAVETNPRFIEAFMVGANHEMNHELHWRQYPTDRRGSPFLRFWDRLQGRDDFPQIQRWTEGLGRNALGGIDSSVVLLIRGELFQHYPNTIIYAAPATSPDYELDTDPTRRKNPTMFGRLEPDISFVMLPLTKEQLIADPGYFIVFQEASTELRLGLDSPTVPETALSQLTDWNDLTWGHVNTEPGQHLAVLTSAAFDHSADGVTFGHNSAHMAKIILQRPVMVAFHADAMIGDQP